MKLTVEILFVLGLLTIVYAMVRGMWRLHTGDVEEAGPTGERSGARARPGTAPAPSR